MAVKDALSAQHAHTTFWAAGFRFVKINLRIESGMARRLGVDTHVCELILLLTACAKLQVRLCLFVHPLSSTLVRWALPRLPTLSFGFSFALSAVVRFWFLVSLTLIEHS